MPTDVVNEPKVKSIAPGQEFVDTTSLKSYAVATGSLTVVMNILLFLYSTMKDGQVMPNKLALPFAILLSISYVMSFFKRDPMLTFAQHSWVIGLNSIMLFTSISGVNGMLDTARHSFDQKNRPMTSNPAQAGIGSFFEHIFFPTHGWFNTSDIDEAKREMAIESTLTSIDTTQKLIDTLIMQKQRDIAIIDTLHRELATVREQYISTLEKFTETARTIGNLQEALANHGTDQPVQANVAKLQVTIDSNILILKEQEKKQVFLAKRQKQQQEQVQEPINELEQQQQQLIKQKAVLQQQQMQRPIQKYQKLHLNRE